MKFIIKGMLRLQEGFGAFLLVVFFLAIVLQISARYLHVPLLWTEEVANYSFIWAVFMGSAAMVYHRAHFSFNFFRDRFTGRRAALYNIMLSVLVLCFTIPMTWYGVIIARTFWNYNWITLPWMKMGYTWLCLPIAGFTMSIYSLSHIVSDWRRAQAEEETA